MRKYKIASFLTVFALLFSSITLTSKVYATTPECYIFEDKFNGSFAYNYVTNSAVNASYSNVNNMLHFDLDPQIPTHNDTASIRISGPLFDYDTGYIATKILKNIQTSIASSDIYFSESFIIESATGSAYSHYVNTVVTKNSFSNNYQVTITNNLAVNQNTSVQYTSTTFNLSSSPTDLKIIMKKNFNHVEAYYQFPGGNWISVGNNINIPTLQSNVDDVRVKTYLNFENNSSLFPYINVDVNYDDLIIKKPGC